MSGITLDQRAAFHIRRSTLAGCQTNVSPRIYIFPNVLTSDVSTIVSYLLLGAESPELVPVHLARDVWVRDSCQLLRFPCCGFQGTLPPPYRLVFLRHVAYPYPIGRSWLIPLADRVFFFSGSSCSINWYPYMVCEFLSYFPFGEGTRKPWSRSRTIFFSCAFFLKYPPPSVGCF